MSLIPPFSNIGKRCFVYCGDDYCNCDCNPRYRDMIYNQQISDDCNRDKLDDRSSNWQETGL